MVQPMPMGGAQGQQQIDPALLEQLLQQQQQGGQPPVDPNDPNAALPQGDQGQDPNDPNAQDGQDDQDGDGELDDPASYYNEGEGDDPDYSQEDDEDEDPQSSRQPIQKGLSPMNNQSPLVVRDSELSDLISQVVVKALAPFTAKMNELVKAQNDAPDAIKALVSAEIETVVKSLQNPVPVAPVVASVVPANPEASTTGDVNKALGGGETIDPAAVVNPAAEKKVFDLANLIKSAVAIRENDRIDPSLRGEVIKSLRQVQTEGDRSEASLQNLADAIKKVSN